MHFCASLRDFRAPFTDLNFADGFKTFAALVYHGIVFRLVAAELVLTISMFDNTLRIDLFAGLDGFGIGALPGGNLRVAAFTYIHR